jgi:glycosyltransferase involved in cell wall biosynthesis
MTAKLVFYSHTSSVSGAEATLLGLLTGLDRSRFRLVLLCPVGALSEACLAAGVEHRPVPALVARFTSNPFQLLRYSASLMASMVSLRKELRRQMPDLVHANGIRAALVASLASLGLGIPILWHIHDILPNHLFTFFIRRLARTLPSVALLTPSQATANCFRGETKDVVHKPIEVILSSVDLARFYPDSAARERMRRELGLQDHQIAIGVIGQITARKGLIELVEAFAEARSRMPEAVLVLVGAALFNEANRIYADTLKQRIDALKIADRVWLVGSKPDIPAVMNAVDLLAQNSFIEPLGLALMEGFACGRTAAATAVDGTLEIVDHGRTGLLTPPRNPAALVSAIETLVKDAEMRLRLGNAARQKMLDGFSPEFYMQQMQCLYERLIGARASGDTNPGISSV